MLVVLVRYDAIENRVVTDLAQQRRILNHRYISQHKHSAFHLYNCHLSFKTSLVQLSTSSIDVLCRYYLVERAKDANIVGILVGTLGVGMFLSCLWFFFCVIIANLPWVGRNLHCCMPFLVTIANFLSTFFIFLYLCLILHYVWHLHTCILFFACLLLFLLQPILVSVLAFYIILWTWKSKTSEFIIMFSFF